MIIIRTFRQIEQHLGRKAKSGSGDSPLEVWYEHIRDKQLNEFTDGDFAKCCRQELYLEFVLPWVIERIETDTLAGEMYDGEVLVALAGISGAFWIEHQSLADRVRAVLARETHSDDEQLLRAIAKLQKRVAN